MVTWTSAPGVENEGSNPKPALISYLTFRKSLNLSPVQEDNNANHEVNVRAGLYNGAENTSHTFKTLEECSYRKGKRTISLGGDHLIIYRKRYSFKVIVILLKWITTD